MTAKEIDAILAQTPESERITRMNDLASSLQSLNIQLMKELSERAQKAAQQAGDKAGLMNAARNLGVASSVLGDNDRALKYFRESLNIAQEIQHLQGIARANVNLGYVYTQMAQYAQGLEWYLKALPIAESLADKRILCILNSYIGKLYLHLNQIDLAMEFLEKGLELSRETEDQTAAIRALQGLGEVHKRLENFEEAMLKQRQALSIARKLGDKFYLTTVISSLGELEMDQAQYEEAIDLFRSALNIAQQLGNKQEVGYQHLRLSCAYFALKEDEEAQNEAEEALILGQDISSPDIQSQAYMILAQIYERAKNYQLSLEYYKQFTRLREQVLQGINRQSVKFLETSLQIEKEQREKERQQREKEIYRLQNIELANALRIIEEKNADITASIRYARRIQEAMLPSDAEFKELLPESFVFYRPKDIVSGDFYWIGQQKDKIFVAACDGTGHGVPGALMSAIGLNLLNELVLRQKAKEPRPDYILNQMHQMLRKWLHQDQEETETRDGMDACICCLQPHKKIVYYSGAKIPLYQVSGNQIIEHKPDKMPLGGEQIEIERIFSCQTITYQPGDMFYMVSDGYADQFGGTEGKRFQTKRLKEMMLSLARVPMAGQRSQFESRFDAWRGEYEQMDDLMVIGFRL
jgi:serine phosphatase RsbU (regulator of sigma subunit)